MQLINYYIYILNMEENEIEKLFLTTFTAFRENKNTQINMA